MRNVTALGLGLRLSRSLSLLDSGTVHQVKDWVKEIIDVVGKRGGWMIYDQGYGLLWTVLCFGGVLVYHEY